MVDLSYAALFFGDEQMAVEVARARGAPQRPRARDARDLRARGPVSARRRADVERAPRRLRHRTHGERRASTSSRIVTHHLGIPPVLVADLAAAEEVSHRVRVRRRLRARATARSPTSSCRSRSACGSWRSAADKEWIIDPDGDEVHDARRHPDPAGPVRRDPGAARARRRTRVAPAARRRGPRDQRPRPRRRRARRDEERLGGRRRPRVLGAAVQRPEPGGRGRPRSRTGSTRCASGSRSGCCAARPTRSTRRRCAGCCTSARPPRRSATPRSRWSGSSRRARRCTPSSRWRSASPTR